MFSSFFRVVCALKKICMCVFVSSCSCVCGSLVPFGNPLHDVIYIFFFPQCRKNSSRLCRRVRELRRKLVTLQAEIHKGRLNWVKLTNEEKRDFASRYTARVSTFANVTKSLSQAVHRMKKQEKLDKLNTKKRRRNQVPLDGVQRLRLRRKRARTQRLSRSFE